MRASGRAEECLGLASQVPEDGLVEGRQRGRARRRGGYDADRGSGARCRPETGWGPLMRAPAEAAARAPESGRICT